MRGETDPDTPLLPDVPYYDLDYLYLARHLWRKHGVILTPDDYARIPVDLFSQFDALDAHEAHHKERKP